MADPRRAPLLGGQHAEGETELEVGPLLRALRHPTVPVHTPDLRGRR
jgi:hypothetical protein